MHYLIEQFIHDPSQSQGRRDRLSANGDRTKLRYFAPNGVPFFIDCSDAGDKDEPLVHSPVATPYGVSHATHTLGKGRVCLALSIRGWELSQVLLYCDSWAKGIRIYEATGSFPANPKAIFAWHS